MKRSVFITIILIVFVLSHVAPGQEKGVRSNIKPPFRGGKIGKQYLALIAINKYHNWNPISGPREDAEKIKNILTSRYYIDEIKELYDEQATKGKIIQLLIELQESVAADDSLIILFSGHGNLDESSNNGFWIPVDGGVDKYTQDKWIPNSIIKGLIANMKSRHILLISDSCYSGELIESFRGEKPGEITNEYLKKIYSRRCRQIMTSGASERVPAKSEFARQLILALAENSRSFIDSSILFNEIKLGVKKSMPLFGELKETGHQDGAGFLFFLKPEQKKSTTGPKSPPKVDFSDLEQWSNWQKSFEGAVKKAKEFAEKSTDINIKKEAWERVLNLYKEDNPFSEKDEELRKYIKQRILALDQERIKPQPKPEKKKQSKSRKKRNPFGIRLNSKAKEIYMNSKFCWEAEFDYSIVMVYITPGVFTMGSNEESDEKPVHKVNLDGYWIGKYEVTFDQYDKYCVDTGKKKPGDSGWGRGSRPVIHVSWNDAAAFCEWLEEKTGLEFKLPTEAQWEKAARGNKEWIYPWGNTIYKSRCNSIESELKKTSPVGNFPGGISPYGCEDMAGNVWEWCFDWYRDNYYKNSPSKNPKGPDSSPYLTGGGRVMRGGSWAQNARSCRVSCRTSSPPDFQNNFCGFRLAMTL